MTIGLRTTRNRGKVTPLALPAAKATAQLAHAARVHGVPVIYANDNFGIWRSNFDAMAQRLVRSGGASGQMAQLLRPKKGDLTVLKPMHSAFFGTPLDIILQKMGVRSLVLTGLATDICILLTAADAFLRGLQVWVPHQCTAAETEQKKQSALVYMRDILQCKVVSLPAHYGRPEEPGESDQGATTASLRRASTRSRSQPRRTAL